MSRQRLLSKRTVSLLTGIAMLVVVIGQQLGWWQTTQQAAEQHQPGTYAVRRFVDGDTIVVDMDGKKETVRMIGVDTPETHKPNTPVQCYGPAAAAFTKNLIGAQRVRLEADPTNQNRDRYGRLLRYVYLADGRLVEKELINGGYGFSYTLFPFTKTTEFEEAEASAQASSKGLWGTCTVKRLDNGVEQTNAAS